ncbi:DEAD/DEAH box helicase [Enterococcus sp.]|uniref:DEAD/DEAH box helicase n=1 Tax=Enterococcus sp. TaxID=35783 RepID=UPI002FCC5C57
MKWSIPERVIERGRDYLNQDRVLSVVADEDNQVWRAEVLGSELYRVDLDATAKEEDYCQCPYWEEHHFCKHTVAVELYLRKKGLTRQIKAEKTTTPISFSNSEMFSKGFYRLQEEKNNQPLIQRLEISCQIDSLATNPYRKELDVLGISLKLGLQGERKYVIKNIYRFLQVYQDEKMYSGIKQGTFHLHPDAFSEAENDVLRHLLNNAQTQQLLGHTGVQVNGVLDKKYLLLPVSEGQELLEKMQKIPFVFVSGDKKYSKLPFSDQPLPLAFTLKPHDETSYELTQVHDFDHVYQAYRWGIFKGEIYQMTAEEMEICLTTMQLMKRLDEPKIIYPKKELSLLFRQVFPFLRQVGQVDIDPEVYDAVSEAALEVILYLRRKQGKIDVRVDYKYDDIVFSSHTAFENNPEDAPEVLRDYQAESRVVQMLEQFQFKQDTQPGWQKEIPKGVQLFQFFNHEVPTLRQLGKIHVGKKLKEMYLDGEDFRPVIEVGQEDSWLNVSFDISGISENEVQEVLRSLLRQEAFYTLADGKVLSLMDEQFQETSRILQQLRQELKEGTTKFEIPLHRGLQLQAHLGEKAQFSQSFDQLTKHLVDPSSFEATLPKNLQADLREYQVLGFRWLKMLSHYSFGGILADEMGLGKTLQTIAFLLSEKETKTKIPTLIVTPASLTYNWQQEIKRFAPDLSSVVVHGTKEERQAILAGEKDIYITSYTSLRQDVETYQTKKFTYLILDEAQMVKNSYTKTAQALQSLVIPVRFALSGTPIENNLDELWGLFQLIMPGFFPTRQKYRELTAEEIARMVKPFVLRRDKKSVLKDLPEKIERNYYSGLTAEQKTVYLAYLQQMREEVSGMDSDTFRKNRISILAGLTRLRQICCDPRLFLDDYEGTSGKLEQVKMLVKTAIENNRRVLLFSQFTGMLSILEEVFAEMDISTFYLRGSTPPKERVDMVNAYNAGEKEVFLISLKAGGTGLNLTGADTVILYDLWWNPAVEEQAAGRAHRMGQKKVVEVWRMIAEGTIEERMDALQQEKRELFQKVIQGNETQLQQLTEEDIRLILSMGEE